MYIRMKTVIESVAEEFHNEKNVFLTHLNDLHAVLAISQNYNYWPNWFYKACSVLLKRKMLRNLFL